MISRSVAPADHSASGCCCDLAAWDDGERRRPSRTQSLLYDKVILLAIVRTGSVTTLSGTIKLGLAFGVSLSVCQQNTGPSGIQ
jgi:hypothetical protein